MFTKSDVDKIISAITITPVEKLVIIGLLRQGLTARDIAAVTGTSPRAVYYALDNLIKLKIIINCVGTYVLTKKYLQILCKKCKLPMRARTRKSLQFDSTVSPPRDSAELDKKIP